MKFKTCCQPHFYVSFGPLIEVAIQTWLFWNYRLFNIRQTSRKQSWTEAAVEGRTFFILCELSKCPDNNCVPWWSLWSEVTFCGEARNIVFSCWKCCTLDWFWSQYHFFRVLFSARTRRHFYLVVFLFETGWTQDFDQQQLRLSQHCSGTITMENNFTLCFLKPKWHSHLFYFNSLLYFLFYFWSCFLKMFQNS